jgi:hypothetical protein
VLRATCHRLNVASTTSRPTGRIGGLGDLCKTSLPVEHSTHWLHECPGVDLVAVARREGIDLILKVAHVILFV